MGGNPGMFGGGRQRMSMGGGNTPPLPALSPGPDSSPDHTKSNKANKSNNNSRPGRQFNA